MEDFSEFLLDDFKRIAIPFFESAPKQHSFIKNSGSVLSTSFNFKVIQATQSREKVNRTSKEAIKESDHDQTKEAAQSKVPRTRKRKSDAVSKQQPEKLITGQIAKDSRTDQEEINSEQHIGGLSMTHLDMNVCKKILQKVMNHEFAWPFNEPVDPVALGIPDYFQVITHPMDFGTIKDQLRQELYTTKEEFFKDIRLVFSNALTFNAPHTDVYIMAQSLSEHFEELYSSVVLQQPPDRPKKKKKEKEKEKEKKCKEVLFDEELDV